MPLTDPLDELIHVLVLRADEGFCPEAVVLAQGRLHTPTPWPAGMPRRSIGGKPFRNALRVARASAGSLAYAEGFALRGREVVHHAWCVDVRGTAMDPTWPDGDGLAYVGVTLAGEWVEAVRRRTGTRTAFPGVLDAHTQHTRDADRILTYGIPPTALLPVGTPARELTEPISLSPRNRVREEVERSVGSC
ncbi:hypothetical protein SAMN05216371_8271 [Streptomyces sp. TLI_053]|uniref:hypothetical protein n=1 Tax=Streptomyces sp. TLI_053 TaxID=1855352 RepID=UPI000879A800|nr:hypothetical protein [Streptomyces sp. TLI_053]SDT83440.1 hypothetical protein SAMN05216371_8271 [Streptomyces sp. TLI_053]